MPIIYEGVTLDAGLRLDIVVADRIVVEIKAVERLIPLFDAQVLTYLKLTRMELGLLINFNVSLIKNGIRRIVLRQTIVEKLLVGLSFVSSCLRGENFGFRA